MIKMREKHTNEKNPLGQQFIQQTVPQCCRRRHGQVGDIQICTICIASLHCTLPLSVRSCVPLCSLRQKKDSNMSANYRAVRHAYRLLLRAQKKAFANDLEMQASAKRTIRQEFDKNKKNIREMDVIAKLMAAEETAKFLNDNIVQAPLNDRGNYVLKPTEVSSSTAPKQKRGAKGGHRRKVK